MNILYFTIFTGIESIPPGTSNLGVMIQIRFRYTMQHEERGEFQEVLFPGMHESTLRGDAVSSLMRPFNGTKSAVMGCLPH